MKRCALLILSGILGWVPLAHGEAPYVFQRGALEAETRAEAEVFAAVGTRELRTLGARGVAQGARIRLGLLDHTTFEVTGAMVGTLSNDAPRTSLFGAELVQRVADVRQLGVDLDVAVGVLRDAQATVVPRLRVVAGRSWGRLHAQVSGLMEKPLSSRRDALDMVLGAAASWQAAAKTTIGVEAMAEDLEAAWDPAEAEGGARVLAGPSLHTQWDHIHVSVLAAATRASIAPGTPPSMGVLGRVGVGLRF